MVEAAQSLTLEQSLEWFDDALVRAVGDLVVDRKIAHTNTAALVAHLNRDFRDGVLRGVSNATISTEGHKLDDKRRPYSVTEIGLLLTLPTVLSYIDELRKERDLEAADEQYAAKVDALAHARAAKAAKHDRSIVPALYAEVAELRRVVEWLVDGMDRQMGVLPLKQPPVWSLPELKD